VKCKAKWQRWSMKSARQSRNVGGASAPRPFVAVTFAMTVDGKVTPKNYSAVDFTSREDKDHLIRHRALGDHVVVRDGPLENDNPRLVIRREELRQERIARGQTPYPLRVIVSNKGRINPRLKIFETDLAPIIIFSTIRMPRRTREQLREKATLYLSQACR